MNAKKVQTKFFIRLPLLSELENNVNQTIIGQEDVVRAVCTKVYEGICFPYIKSNILIYLNFLMKSKTHFNPPYCMSYLGLLL